MNMHTLTKL